MIHLLTVFSSWHGVGGWNPSPFHELSVRIKAALSPLQGLVEVLQGAATQLRTGRDWAKPLQTFIPSDLIFLFFVRLQNDRWLTDRVAGCLVYQQRSARRTKQKQKTKSVSGGSWPPRPRGRLTRLVSLCIKEKKSILLVLQCLRKLVLTVLRVFTQSSVRTAAAHTDPTSGGRSRISAAHWSAPAAKLDAWTARPSLKVRKTQKHQDQKRLLFSVRMHDSLQQLGG